MKTQEYNQEIKLAKSVALEDLCAGDYLAILYENYELPSFLWRCDSVDRPREKTVRVQYRARDCELPLKVIDICLPFVYVKTPTGSKRVLDTFYFQFVRLDRQFAREIWNDQQSRKNSKRKGKRKNK